MVKHVILWKFKETDDETRNSRVAEIKKQLENLSGKIPGMTEIRVTCSCLESSNADAMLECIFEDEEALHGYSANPEHVMVAETFIRPYIETRMCFDFEI